MELPNNMKRSIKIATWITASAGVPGAFIAHSDTPVIALVWADLLIRLAKQSGRQIDKDTAIKIVAGVTTGIVTFATGVKVATTAFAWTGVGTLPAMAANAGLNGGLTYTFGQATARTFLNPNVSESAEDLIKAIVALILGWGNEHGSASA